MYKLFLMILNILTRCTTYRVHTVYNKYTMLDDMNIRVFMEESSCFVAVFFEIIIKQCKCISCRNKCSVFLLILSEHFNSSCNAYFVIVKAVLLYSTQNKVLSTSVARKLLFYLLFADMCMYFKIKL